MRTGVEFDKAFELYDLMNGMETIAEKYHGGHFTVFKFTTNWKGIWTSPPTANWGHPDDPNSFYSKFTASKGFNTLEELLKAMLKPYSWIPGNRSYD